MSVVEIGGVSEVEAGDSTSYAGALSGSGFTVELDTKGTPEIELGSTLNNGAV